MRGILEIFDVQPSSSIAQQHSSTALPPDGRRATDPPKFPERAGLGLESCTALQAAGKCALADGGTNQLQTTGAFKMFSFLAPKT